MNASKSLKKIRQTGGLVLLIIAIIIIFSAATGGLFITFKNVKNILVSSALNGIVGIGMTFVLITGGIDLSVSGNVVMTSLIMAQLMKDGTPWLLVLLIGLVISSLVGLVNGISVGRFGMVAFVVTMAVGNITTGYGKMFSNGLTVYGFPDIHQIFNQSLFGVIPGPVIMTVVIGLIASYVLRYTNYGRKLYATGGNTNAAWMAGIQTTKIVIVAYIVSGFLCGWGAILMTSKLMSASASIASTLQMDAIASCVLGGTSLSGGVGTVGGTILGAIAMAMISNGLNLMGVTPFAQEICKGVIIFVVVALDAYQKSKVNRR